MPEQNKKKYNQKVDFHSHFLSPTYYEYLDKYEGECPDSFPTPQWNIEDHMKQMDALGIAFSLLSISSPNLSKAPKEEEIAMVHKINQEGHELVEQYPLRLGLLAELPLPYVTEAVEELHYAVDELHVDGFGLSTNYAGVYLGDPLLDPLMEQLNQLHALVTVHPVKPAVLPKGVNRSVPIPAMEFMMDTTRTFMNMEMNDIFQRYPAIRWVFPHAGAFISILSDRMNGFAVLMKQEDPALKLDMKTDMRHVYFDLAGFPLQKQLHALVKDVPINNMLYGSDAPYTPGIACTALSGGLETISGLSAGDKQAIFTENAVRLVPRLAQILGVEVCGSSVCYQDCSLTMKERCQRFFRRLVARVYGRIFA